jgi:proline racemase
MRVGDCYIAHSIIGSTFRCHIEAETMLEGHPAVIPVISGQLDHRDAPAHAGPDRPLSQWL